MRRGKLALSAGLIMIIAWASWACKDEVTGPDLSGIIFPDSGVSYSKHVQPLFIRGCGGQESLCHGPDTFEGRLFALDSYLHATAKLGIIARTDPDHSLLINTIEGTSPPKMPPPDKPQLNANQIKGLRRWVKEGAQDN